MLFVHHLLLGRSECLSGGAALKDILNWESPPCRKAVQGLRERKSR